MGKAIAYDYRVKIVKRIELGEKIKDVAEAFGYSENGVRKVWNNYKKEGVDSFGTKYHNCGVKSGYGEDIRDEVSGIRDNNQGAYYVYSKLLEKHDKGAIPCPRTLNNWWKEEKTGNAKGRPGKIKKKLEPTGA